MPFFLVPFLVKGAIIATKTIIASKKVAVVTKVATGAVHTYGAATVASTAAAACITIGGIYWTTDRVEDIEKCYRVWKEGDYAALTSQLASLASKIHSVGTDSIVHSAGKLLTQNGYNSLDVVKFVKDCLDLGSDSLSEYNRPAIG